jgi:glucose/arabinose dehydrogenase/cytochrome c2
MTKYALCAALLCIAACKKPAPQGAEARGEALFRQRCAVCHLTSGSGAQGPGLAGIVGRKAGRGGRFGYTKALRTSALTWDLATLDQFLSAPSRLVPGTTMVVRVSDGAERRDLLAYLATLRPAATPPKAAAAARAPAAAAPPGLLTGAAAMGDYRSDGPGVRRRITVADLPAPFATESARNSPGVVPRPAGAQLRVPAGYRVDQFAGDLDEPRVLRTAPNGDVFVVESAVGRVRVLRAKDLAAKPERNEVFAKGLDQPFGLAFYPPGSDPQWIYVAETNQVVRFPYRNGDLSARGAPETIVGKLSKATGGHWTRDVAFSPDGKRMLVSVGSESNVAQKMATRTLAEAKAFEAAHALGAAWDNEESRADVLAFDPDGKNGGIYATGIRNCVGLAIQPGTGAPWCTTNERDGLGDDLVPDYVTHVQRGAFYGWPWYWLGSNEEPRHKGERPDLAGHVTAPDLLLQSHSAPLGMTFYEGAMFPPEMRGDAFVALHGSWNRAKRTGYKVVRVLLKDGTATGEYEDFLTGFVADDDNVWGRPVGIAVAHDGALLVSEDGNGTIWRVSREK